MKKCLYCAEEIQDAAIKCRYCGEYLAEVPAKTASPSVPEVPAEDAPPPAEVPPPATPTSSYAQTEPKARRDLSQWRRRGCIGCLGLFALLLIVGYIGSCLEKRQTAEIQRKAAVDKAARIAKLSADKPANLEKGVALLEQGDREGALKYLRLVAEVDQSEEVRTMIREAEAVLEAEANAKKEQRLLAELEETTDEDVARRASIYNQLKELRPENKEYRDASWKWGGRLALLEKKEKEAKAPKQSKRAQQRTDEDSCRKDLQCWGDKHSIGASFPCAEAVEKLARYSAKWTDGLLGGKFTRFRWHDKGAGTITYIGDEIQFQNGFGAWQNHVYYCDYDPDSKRVLGARAEPGRLP